MLENISAFALVSWLLCCLAWAGVCEPVREYVRTAYGQTHPGGEKVLARLVGNHRRPFVQDFFPTEILSRTIGPVWWPGGIARRLGGCPGCLPFRASFAPYGCILAAWRPLLPLGPLSPAMSPGLLWLLGASLALSGGPLAAWMLLHTPPAENKKMRGLTDSNGCRTFPAWSRICARSPSMA